LGGRLVMSWSGGKDSAMALHDLQRDHDYEVVGLMTTLSAEHDRVSHHGVRESLLDDQARAIGLPLHKLRWRQPDGVDEAAAMASFERAMEQLLQELRADGVHHVGFGDIFLERTRRYREERLADVGMRPVFPLWSCDTEALLHRFTDDGYEAVVTCAEPVAAALNGVDLSSRLLADAWPAGVDPCGEHGEFHSFVHQGPVFRRPVPFVRGTRVVRDGRHYTDLIPIPHLTP
jgi:uncharacterized protein (TIGR00290 family)